MNNKKTVYTTTFHLANNYGAILQAYALQKFLINNNYDAKILNYDNYKISDHYRIIKKDRSNLFKVLIHVIPRLDKFFSEIKKELNFKNFRKNLKFTEKYSKKTITNNAIKCDAIICGSDQIWNPSITDGLDKVYFLQYGFNCKKIAYSASCGSVKNINDKKLFKKYIDNISGLSARENELKDFIIKECNKRCELTLDPSLLLNKDDWEEFIQDERIIKEKYIFTYSVNNGNELYYETINKLAKKTGFKVIYFDKWCKKIRTNKKCFYSAGPKEFLNLLYNSEFVITTSFHGFALSSVLNKKMLVVLGSYPDRLVTLAKTIGLEDRFIKHINDIESIYNEQILWDEVNYKLDLARKKSQQWLINQIEK